MLKIKVDKKKVMIYGSIIGAMCLGTLIMVYSSFFSGSSGDDSALLVGDDGIPMEEYDDLMNIGGDVAQTIEKVQPSQNLEIKDIIMEILNDPKFSDLKERKIEEGEFEIGKDNPFEPDSDSSLQENEENNNGNEGNEGQDSDNQASELNTIPDIEEPAIIPEAEPLINEDPIIEGPAFEGLYSEELPIIPDQTVE